MSSRNAANASLSKLSFFAPCPRGLEGALAEELEEIAQLPEVKQHVRLVVQQTVLGGVHFSGDLGAAYAVNLHSRIASRVLRRLVAKSYRSEDDVYMLASGQEWEGFFGVDKTLRVDVTAHKSPLKSLNFVGLRIKDAICDRLRDKFGERPSVDTRNPDVRIFAHLTEKDCTIYLDTSGDPLFKRGWRLDKGSAPLKENLAAGILRLSGWQPDQAFYDPMCGSGTFLIEAAQRAWHMAPGAARGFAFENLLDTDKAVWKALRNAARDAEEAFIATHREQPFRIAGSDISTDMLAMVEANWARAGIPVEPEIKQVDARFAKPYFDVEAGEGLLMLNPPYGERIAVRGEKGGKAAGRAERMAREQDDDERQEVGEALGAPPRNPFRDAPVMQQDPAADAFASAFATNLKQNFSGWTAWVFTGDLFLPKRMRLKESRRTPLFNGPIECRLFRFEMVRGGMREKPAE